MPRFSWIAWLPALATPAMAAVYKCQDADGNLVYSQVQCPAGQVEEVTLPPAPERPVELIPAQGADGRIYYVPAGSGPVPDYVETEDYYSIGNQAARMKARREADLQKQLDAEAQARAERKSRAAEKEQHRQAEYQREQAAVQCEEYEAKARHYARQPYRDEEEKRYLASKRRQYETLAEQACH